MADWLNVIIAIGVFGAGALTSVLLFMSTALGHEGLPNIHENEDHRFAPQRRFIIPPPCTN